MERASELFEWLRREGEAAIDQLISERRSESLFLDFKRSADAGRGAILHQDDWKNLAKAVSGFGNSEGGVVVWGVDCKPDPVEGDVPTGKTLIENSPRFVSRLEGAVSGCTVPPHSGVSHHAVSRADGTGFALTLIPRNVAAPLQCIRPPGTLQYYVRAGSSFVPAPHAVLMGMFGRGPQPQLGIRLLPFCQPKEPTEAGAIALQMGVILVNSGPGVCSDTYLSAVMSGPGKPSFIQLSFPMQGKGFSGQMAFGNMASVISDSTFRIAPAAPVQPLVLDLTLGPPFTEPLSISFTYGHRSSPVMKLESTLDVHELTTRHTRLRGALEALALKQNVPVATIQDLARRLIGFDELEG